MKYSNSELIKFEITFGFFYDEYGVYLEVKNNNYINKIKLTNKMINDLNNQNNHNILDMMIDDCLKHIREKKLKALNEIQIK